jgi:CRP-like cAMP-binding protein
MDLHKDRLPAARALARISEREANATARRDAERRAADQQQLAKGVDVQWSELMRVIEELSKELDRAREVPRDLAVKAIRDIEALMAEMEHLADQPVSIWGGRRASYYRA